MSAKETFGVSVDVYSRAGNLIKTHGEWQFDSFKTAQDSVDDVLFKISHELRPGQQFVVRIVKHETVMVSAPQEVS